MTKYILILMFVTFPVFAGTADETCSVFTDVANKMWEYKQTIPKQTAIKQTLVEALKSDWSGFEVIMMVDLIEFVYRSNGIQKEVTNKYEYHCHSMLTPSTEL